MGIPSPCCPPCSSSPGVIARRRPVLLTSLYLGDPLSLTNTGEHFTENTQLFWHCSPYLETIMELFHIFIHITNKKFYLFHWSLVNRPKNLGRGQPPSLFLGSSNFFCDVVPNQGYRRSLSCCPPNWIWSSILLPFFSHNSKQLPSKTGWYWAPNLFLGEN